MRIKGISKNGYLAGLVLAVFLGSGIFHITKFVTADEHYWFYERVPQYWEAIRDGKWKKTKINDKPGISVAIVSGTGLLFEKDIESHYQEKDRFEIFDWRRTEELLFRFRLPILIFNLILGIYIFWSLSKLFEDSHLALWGLALVYLSPILVGMSQIVNPDALIWATSLSGVISFLVFQKTKEMKFILFAGLATGLALLSKYTANILFIFYLAALFLDYLFDSSLHAKEKSLEAARYFRRSFLALGATFLIGAATFAVLMPAAIRNPKHLYLGTLGFESMRPILPFIGAFILLILLDSFLFQSRIVRSVGRLFQKYKKIISGMFFLVMSFLFLLVLLNRIGGFNWLDVEGVPIDAKTADVFADDSGFLKQVFLELYPLIFSLTPLVLLSVLYVWVRRIWTDRSRKYDFLVFSLSSFLAIFVLGAIFSDLLLTTRYWVIIYPFLGLLGALGIAEFWEDFLSGRVRKFYVSLAVILVSGASLFLSAPFYYNYSSFLLPEKYIVSDLWGFGGYEAAEYLNSLPDAENLTIWSDYYGVCEFFRGKCSTDYKFQQPIDYCVLTRRGEIRFWSGYSYYKAKGQPVIEALPYYSPDVPSEWELLVDGREGNSVRVKKTSAD